MSIKEKINIVFENLTYSVIDKLESKSQKREVKKVILNNLSGYFENSKLTAVMGPSGAGKTSLLEILSGQSKAGFVKGNLYLNNKPIRIEELKKISGFVFQDDIILKTMTVNEALNMSATLRLPEDIPIEEKNQRIKEMIKLLHLEKCENTLIGDNLIKGISGGEKKRLSVGMEMLTNPSIIFLDEPTSGLDTFTAFSLIKNLKDLTEMGKTIICTIHQPSSDILRLFDNLIVLNQGNIVYQGEVSNLVNYFSNIGFNCPQFSNPSDFLFMDILNPKVERGDIIDEEFMRNRDEKVYNYYNGKHLVENVLPKCNQCKNELDEISPKNKKYIAPLKIQLKFLLKRYLKNYCRDKTILRTRIGQTIGFGLLVGLTFLNIPGKDAKAQVQNRNGGLFITCFAQTLLPIIGCLALFSQERNLIMREIASGYYKIPAYYLSKMLFEVPIQMVLTFISITIIYWMCLFQKEFLKYIKFVGIIELGALCGLSIGILCATSFKNVNMALQVAPFIFIPLILFSGLLINTENIPPYFIWIQFISPIRYTYGEVYKNEFTNLYYKGNSLEYNIEQMGFNKISTKLSLFLLAGITIVLLLASFISLFISIKRGLSKTEYKLNEKEECNNTLVEIYRN